MDTSIWLKLVSTKYVLKYNKAKLQFVARITNLTMNIGLDKSEYQVNSFLITRRKHMLWYSLEAPRQCASNEYPQHMFSLRNKKNIDTFWWKKAPYQELCMNFFKPNMESLIPEFGHIHCCKQAFWLKNQQRNGNQCRS